MKNSILILFAFVHCGSSVFGQTKSEIRDRIVGTWKLLSAEQTMKDGSTRPYPRYGAQGQGFLMYQGDGYMCADLVNPNRPKWADHVHPTPEEKLAAADGTFAYCGRYEIDVQQKQIVHLPEVATDPGFVGSRQIRPYSFQDGHLILSDVEKNDPTVARWKIVWEKAQWVGKEELKMTAKCCNQMFWQFCAVSSPFDECNRDFGRSRCAADACAC